MEQQLGTRRFLVFISIFAFSSFCIWVSSQMLSQISYGLSTTSIEIEAHQSGASTHDSNDNEGAKHHKILRRNNLPLRTIDESELPYKCGMIFFYHIACTGGSSLNKWLGREEKANDKATYFTFWGRKDEAELSFIAGVNKEVQNISAGEWRIVHAHGNSFYPNTSEPYFYQWREEVESQGCKMVITTILREAVGHTISQSKGMINPNLTLDEWIVHLEPENKNDRGIWNTQIDYLLYNRGPRNMHNATKEEKVRRAMELLQRHFDLVFFQEWDKFVSMILKITGWVPVTYRASNTFNGELNYTERELDKIKRLTTLNGDVAFIDAVKHIYYGHLDYLADE